MAFLRKEKEEAKVEVKPSHEKVYFVVTAEVVSGVDWAGRPGFRVKESQLHEVK